MEIRFSCETDVGNKRSVNEDSLWPQSDPHPYVGNPHGLLFIVADGMGGYGAGDVASNLTIDTIYSTYYDPNNPATDVSARLDRAIQEAHQTIKHEAERNPEVAKMGTTVVAAVIKPGTPDYPTQMWIAWVGDSRIYQWSEAGFEQRTEDHSELWPMIKAGQISWDELHYHPHRSKITNSLTARRSVVNVSHGQYTLRPGDQVLLCSDGVTSEVKDDEIRHILATHAPATAVTTLIDKAKTPKTWLKEGQPMRSKGGEDNITAIVLEIPGGRTRTTTLPRTASIAPAGSKNSRLIWIGAAVIALLLVLIGGGLAVLLLGGSSNAAESTAVAMSPEPPVAESPPPTEDTGSSMTIEPTATPATAAVAAESTVSEQTSVTQTNPVDPNTAGDTADQTIDPPTAEPTLAPTSTRVPFNPTPRVFPSATPVPTVDASAPQLPTPPGAAAVPAEEDPATPSLPEGMSGQITLIAPEQAAVLPNSASNVEFKWQYGNTCELPVGMGFEVVVSKDNSNFYGLYDATQTQNQTTCAGGVYTHNAGDFQSAPAGGPTGQFYWRVLLVNIDPYDGAALAQADGGEFSLAGAGGSGGGGSGSGSGGGSFD